MSQLVTRHVTGAEALIGVAVLAALSVWYAPMAVAVPAGLLLAFVLPGLAAMAALGRGTTITSLERAVLVPALSLAVVVLGGLGLHASGVRLTRESWAALTVTVTVAAAAAAIFRARRAATPGEAVARAAGPAEIRISGRALVPFAIGAALLGGAAWISIGSAAAVSSDQVTSLAAVSTGALPAAPAGVPAAAVPQGRTILVELTNGEATHDRFLVRVRPAIGSTSDIDVAVEENRTWSRRIEVPPGTVTIDLYRLGETEPLRTVFVDGAQ